MNSKNTGKIKVKTTKTAFKIIEFLRLEDGASLKEISNMTGLAQSTIHNHLSTLLRMGYVVKENSIYYPGSRFVQMGNYVRNRKNEYELIREKVDELAKVTDERALFFIPENGLGICLYSIGGNHAVRTDPKVGTQVYLHASASGKAILSQKPIWDVDWVLRRWGLPNLTESTITTKEELIEELMLIRDRGYSVNSGENISGVRAIGVPLNYNNGETLGAISIMGPTHRMNDERVTDELPKLLLGIKNELELNIEYM